MSTQTANTRHQSNFGAKGWLMIFADVMLYFYAGYCRTA